jgi:hypothetical protein
MIKRITYALRRLGDRMFPLPDPNALALEYAMHATREAMRNEAMVELYRLEAEKASLTAAMLRQRAARMSPPPPDAPFPSLTEGGAA